jgi:hypothetical protein
MGSDFLYATPSVVSGLARTLDLAGQFDEYNTSPSGEVADWLALRADWRVVGESLASAMKLIVITEPDADHVQTEPTTK